MTTRTSAMALSALALIAAAALVTAGPLNPPAGPVTSTYKTITDVEPRTAINAANTPGTSTCVYRITQPGSYYLTGNLTGAAGKNGIEIEANDVTIDLKGFTLTGVSGSQTGVYASIPARNITVMNGVVKDWEVDGINLRSYTVSAACSVRGVTATGNLGSGIRCSNNGITENCTANGNGSSGGYGIEGGEGSIVRGCAAAANSFGGITIGTGGTMIDCAARQNLGTGIVGGANSTLTRCTSTGNFNASPGIFTGEGCTVVECTAASNTGLGIFAGTGSTVTDCTAYQNATIGISTSGVCTVSRCTSYANTTHGITTSLGSTIADCTSRANFLDGILCSGACVIRNNSCSSNGNGGDGAGIHATGNDNRIEGNNCTGADRGIGVDAAGNIIIRNTCSGNAPDWVFAANNNFGPIIDRRSPASAAVSGYVAATTLVSTDPNANFSY